jgi:hypothetical protein
MVGNGDLTMPSSPHLVIRAGSRGRRAYVFARDAGTGALGVRGLRYDSLGARAGYLRSGSAEVRRIALRPGHADRHVPGGFREVDAGLLPGVYEIGLPDEVLAGGAPRVIVSIQAPGATIEPVMISLVAYDPREPERLGMASLEWPARWRFLRRGLPKLTSMELALRGERE